MEVITHTFVVYCMLLNPTMCRSLEIIKDDYTYATTQMECMKGGAIYSGNGLRFDLDGATWVVKGTRCSAEGSEPTTIQKRLRASVTP